MTCVGPGREAPRQTLTAPVSCRRERTDLVIMGTEKLSQEHSMGSVALAVLKATTMPVMVVKADILTECTKEDVDKMTRAERRCAPPSPCHRLPEYVPNPREAYSGDPNMCLAYAVPSAVTSRHDIRVPKLVCIMFPM